MSWQQHICWSKTHLAQELKSFATDGPRCPFNKLNVMYFPVKKKEKKLNLWLKRELLVTFLQDNVNISSLLYLKMKTIHFYNLTNCQTSKGEAHLANINQQHNLQSQLGLKILLYIRYARHHCYISQWFVDCRQEALTSAGSGDNGKPAMLLFCNWCREVTWNAGECWRKPSRSNPLTKVSLL